MSVETVFLVVLVVALFIGNMLLSFIPTQGRAKNGGLQTQLLAPSAPVFGGSDLPLNRPQNFLGESGVVLSNVKALHNKITLLSNQVELIDSNVKKFDNFRANTSVELVAMKEILIELQNKYITAKAKTASPKDLSGKEMHRIIYRSK